MDRRAKAFLLIGLVLFLCTFLVPGARAEKGEPVMQSDLYLDQLRSRLPAGWSMTESERVLTLQSRTGCYLLAENKLNAPRSGETEAERKARFEKYGRLSYPAFTFRIQKRRDKALLFKDIEYNIDLRRRLAEPAKEHAQLAADQTGQRQSGGSEQERERLASSLKALPLFLTTLYELYPEQQVGLETEYESIYPAAAAAETRQVKQLLGQSLINPVWPGETGAALALADFAGQTVCFFGSVSSIYNQHKILHFDTHPRDYYVDMDDGRQLIVYTREPITAQGRLLFTGQVVAVPWERVSEAGSVEAHPKLAPGETFTEFHLLAGQIE